MSIVRDWENEFSIHSVRCHWVIYTVTALTVDLFTYFWVNMNFVGQFALGCMDCFCSKAVFVIFNGYCNKKKHNAKFRRFSFLVTENMPCNSKLVGSNPRWVDICRLIGCSEIVLKLWMEQNIELKVVCKPLSTSADLLISRLEPAYFKISCQGNSFILTAWTDNDSYFPFSEPCPWLINTFTPGLNKS